MSHDNEPIFSPADWLLALGLVLCVLVLLVHKLLAVPATNYAAATSYVRPAPVYGDNSLVLQRQHAYVYRETRYEEAVAWQKWHAKVLLDAKIKAQKLAAAQLAAKQSGPISTLGFSAFKACVAMRESGDGTTSSNIYGILGGLWPGVPNPQVDPWYPLASQYKSAWDAPAWVQSKVFDMIYAQQGTGPWAAYDGC